MANLTPEQERVVTTTGKNMLVSASAGSGKTYTMIERIIYLIKTQKVSIKDMLIVTFTNAAATEMKQKITERLLKEVEEDEFLKEEFNHIINADIFTLDAFCSKIVKQHFYEIGVDPAFRILEKEESTSLSNDALTSVLNAYVKKDDVLFNELFETYNKKRRDIEIKYEILHLYNFLKSKHNYKNFINNILDITYTTDLNNNLCAVYLNQLLLELVNHFKGVFLDFKIQAEMLKSDVLLEVLNDILSGISRIKEDNTFIENVKALSDLEKLPEMRKKVLDDAKELKQQIGLVKNAFKKELDAFKIIFKNGDVEEVKMQLQMAKPRLQKMLELVEAFDDAYLKLKKERAMLDFSDLEFYTLEILKNETIRKSIEDRYEYVFIDEYQDTNNLQEEIISKIVKTNNAFMVGDVKQSIYKFRECDPQIFVKKYEDYKTDANSLKIDLNENFRSEKAVLDFSNFVFSNIMRKSTASVNYKDTAKFVSGASFKQEENALPLVTISILDAEEIKNSKKEEEKIAPKIYSVLEHTNELNEEELLEEETTAIYETRLIAKKINEFKNIKIYDTKLNDFRAVKFSDIAVLSRVRSNTKTICKELENASIPVSAKYTQNIYSSYEVSLIINYLRLINNVQDDIALVSVLSSHMFNLTYDELSRVRVHSPNLKNFYGAVFSYLKENKLDEISLKINKLFDDLKTYHKKLTFLDVPSLIKDIIKTYELNKYFLSLPNGGERISNLEMFILSSKKPELQNSLYKYLDYLETFGDTEECEIGMNHNENSVTVTTIHASKGLEYPIVILTGAGREFNKRNATNAEIIINKDFGFGTRYYDLKSRIKTDTIIKNAIELKNKEEDLAEEMRLLYVAVTRAKNHLVVLGKLNLKNTEELNSIYSIKNAKNYLEWIVGSMGSGELNALKAGNRMLDLPLYDGTQCRFEVCDLDGLRQGKEIKQELKLGKANEIYTSAIKKVLDYVYPYKENENILTKSSATEILLSEENEFNNYSIKKFRVDEIYNKKDELDFSLIGTIYHTIMENIPVSCTTLDEVKAEVEKMILSYILPPETLELINLNQILNAVLCINELTKNATEVQKEKQFIMYIPYNEVFSNSNVTDKILVQGVIDLIIETKDEIIILDYKTTRLNSDEELAKKYATQLELYKKAYEKASGKKVTQKLIYSFYLNHTVNV